MFYLLGIPLAIAGAKLLHDDVKYASMDLRTPKAAYNVSLQYKQIDEHFIDILRYSGAKCEVKKIGHNKYDIRNVKKGQYGGMEKYLAEKGYFPQAINYAKKQFDKIADEEEKIKSRQRNDEINRYERKLLTETSENVVITINFSKLSYNKSKSLVEKDVKKLIDYFHVHNNENVFCNIIMENDNFWHHKEVWHIKKPSSENAENYYNNVYNELINKPLSKPQNMNVIADNKWKKCPKCGAKIPKTLKECYYCKSSSNTKNNDNKWKTCPHCNKTVNRVAKNCPYCNYKFINHRFDEQIELPETSRQALGIKYEKYCPNCGSDYMKTAVKCNYCGNTKLEDLKYKNKKIVTKHINKNGLSFDYPDYYDIGNYPSSDEYHQSIVALSHRERACELYIMEYRPNHFDNKAKTNPRLLKEYLKMQGYTYISEKKRRTQLLYCRYPVTTRKT